MHTETADLTMHIPMERIHRRARGLRALRSAAVAAAFAVVVSAAAVPGFALVHNARQTGGLQTGGPPASVSSACPAPALGSPGTPALLGAVVETGASIEGAGGKRYDVVLALTGERKDPLFTAAFRDQQTGYVRPWHMIEVPRGPAGEFAAKGRTWRFQSSQLPLGADSVLDAGIYGGTAHRITVASEGHGSDAHVSENAVTGWTFFWVQRTAKPIPADANGGPQEYTGPERLTITAYDAAGRPDHTVTGGTETGIRMQNPRDNSPDPRGTPTPGIPCS
jgi:hypothetical protein